MNAVPPDTATRRSSSNPAPKKGNMLTDLPTTATLTGDRPAASAGSMLGFRDQLAAIAVERTRMPMVVSDPRLPDNPIVLANRAFLDLSGYAADDVVGRNCRFLQGPATDPAAVTAVRDAIAAACEIDIELLNYRADGTSFWCRLFISPILDDAGKLLYFFASQSDVTSERRMREMASGEHRLLREVDHRAKNALALVQGIVRLTRADDAASYSRNVQSRVDALALAHGILSDAHWQDVPLTRIVGGVVAPFETKQLSFGGAPVRIAAAQVQPLVLLLHELVANAAQHGALSVPVGAMAITWQDRDDQIVIALDETGGPPPKSVRVPGFGLTMVDAFVRRQLRGDVDLAWQDDGLHAVLTLPVVARAA